MLIGSIVQQRYYRDPASRPRVGQTSKAGLCVCFYIRGRRNELQFRRSNPVGIPVNFPHSTYRIPQKVKPSMHTRQSSLGCRRMFSFAIAVLVLAGSAFATTEKVVYGFLGQPDGVNPNAGLVADAAGNLYGTTSFGGTDSACSCGTVFELSPPATAGGAWTEKILYSFQGGVDGSSPISSLVADGHGTFYGTTSADGAACGCGTIFKMTPSASGTWTESVVYRFPGAPGLGNAYNGIITDGAGNFYGTTVSGGTANDGAIYELTP